MNTEIQNTKECFVQLWRELLRALVAVKLGIGMRKVDVKALDEAYSIAFPHSTPINVRKRKKRVKPPEDQKSAV